MSLDSGAKLGAFEITGLLGKGGMGEVYRARDTKLGREVAIKVLPDAIARDPEYLARFEKEAKVLASLSHANVGAIHEFQLQDGVHFLVMDLVEGDTLSQVVRHHRLPIREVLPIFVQIARGLDAAHEAGIVHRDLKPANIKISPKGEVKVLDFGIAKDTSKVKVDRDAPTTPMTASPVTGEGMVIGTPQYMSPEQARGKPVDKRTDVWAFGCCLYEALTGDMPFTGETMSDIVAAILERDVDWSKLPQLPPRIRSVLRRSLAKDPNKRLSSMGDIAILLEEAEDALNHPEMLDAPRRSAVSIVLTAVVALIVGVSATLALTRGGEGTTPGPTSIVAGDSPQKITTIAVLPFENYSGDESQEYFANGMTETLTAELAKINSITVKARTSAMRYKGTDKTRDQIAQELGVQGLIEGSIQRTENEVKITAQLIDGATAEHIWAGNFDGAVENILRLQGEVAIAIAEELDAVLAAEEQELLTRDESVDSTAWDLYLKARDAWRPRTEVGYAQAIQLLEGALAIAPQFADAEALLALVHATRPLNFAKLLPNDDFRLAREYAEHALNLDEHSIDARMALVWVAVPGEWDWKSANRHIASALQIDPEHGYAHVAKGVIELLSGDLHRAKASLQRATELEPHNYPGYWNLARAQEFLGEFDEATAIAKRGAELNPENPVGLDTLADVYVAAGNLEAAVEIASKLDASASAGTRAYVFAFAGMREAAQRAMEESRVRFSSVPNSAPLFGALVQLGLPEVALENLDQQFRLHNIGPVLTSIHRKVESGAFWDDPRYWDLLARYNVPHFAPEHPAYEYQQAYLRQKAAEEVIAAQPKPVRRYIVRPETRIADEALVHRALAISPDGKRVAFVDEGDDRERMIFVRELDSFESRPVPGTEGAINPMFLEDSERILFSDHTRYRLKTVSIHGGAANDIAGARYFLGADRLQGSTFVYVPRWGVPLMTVDIETGETTTLLELDEANGEFHFQWPEVLPNGYVMFVSVRSGRSEREARLELLSPDSMERSVLMKNVFYARYIEPGFILYHDSESLFAVRFDLDSNRMIGAPISIDLDITFTSESRSPQFEVAANGTLVYLPGDGGQRRLVTVTDRGLREHLRSPVRAYRSVSLSRDGTRILANIDGGNMTRSLWTYDLVRGTLSQVIPNGFVYGGFWTAKPSQLQFNRWNPEDQMRSAYTLDLSRPGAEPRLIVEVRRMSGSPDLHPGGKYLAFGNFDDDENVISYIDLSAAEPQAVLLTDAPSWQRDPRFSPDGDWVVYHSHETGTWEVYVIPFLRAGRKMQISSGGGYSPRWDPYRNRIYYRDGKRIMAVDYELNPEFTPSAPQFLFEGGFAGGIDFEDAYAVTEDGQFIMIEKAVDESSEIRVVENWFEVVKEKARAAGALD